MIEIVKQKYYLWIVTVLLLIGAHVFANESIAAKPALLFILDGQSNAGPHGNGDQVAGSWKQVVADTLINPQKVRSDFNDSVAQAWIVANPYAMRSEKFGIANTGFGPELTFIKTLKPYFPNHILAVAQRSLGGTSIVAWDKNHSTPSWHEAMRQTHGENQLPKPPQYPELMELKQQAVTTLNDREDVSSVTVAGFLWVQNEQDTGNSYGAEHYEENLRNLVRNVRADWGVPRLPIMFVNSHTHDGSLNAGRIDAAVEAVKNSEPKTAVINTKDLGVHPAPDLVHYNTNGTVELGIRFANAFRSLYDPNSSPLPSPSPSPSPTHSPSPSPSASASPTSIPSPSPFDYDFNNDGLVNISDLKRMVENMTKQFLALFDSDGNGRINSLDFGAIRKIIPLPSVAPSPSPSNSPFPSPTVSPSPTPSASPPIVDGEIMLIDWNKPAIASDSGFLEAKPAPLYAQGNWVTPVNYAEGTLYFRALVRSIPVNQPGMKLGFCFWQGENNTPSWGEECAASEQVPGVAGTRVDWTRTMADLNPIGNGNDIDWTVDRWKYGMIVRNQYNKPVSKKSGMNWNGEDPAHWYPLDIHFTVVLVRKNKTFSGWQNYGW